MFSSEQTFIIDGDNDKNLEKVIQLIFDISREKVESFYEDSKGLVFCLDKEDGIGYPFEPTINVLVEQINQYIKKLSHEDVKRLAGFAPGIDGTVLLGWEVFCPKYYGTEEIENHKWSELFAVRPKWIIYAK
jgi:hypothetical protein